MIYISLFFINSILSHVTCKKYLPIFESLPPPLVYYAENSEESSKVLTCKAWPPAPLTEIKLYSTMRLTNSDSSSPVISQFMKPAPLHPLDSEYVQGSSVVVRSVIQARALSKLDLHCLAQTQFGAVISRPFRVVEARIGQFPSATNAGEAHKVVKYFLHGNVAYVDCDPPTSYPPATIEFRLNETTIHMSRRYKSIKRPNSQRVTLLILAFEPRDQGYYRCIATNTVTGETKTDPLVQQLKIKSPVINVPVSIKMTISGKEVSDSRPSNSEVDVISVREGTNVTLFCVMEGAPPPTVTTYQVRSNINYQHRFVSDKEFGLLTISKVTVDDEDTCVCSESLTTDTVTLKVQKRLSITQGPKDIRVTELGSQARFTCLSNDANVTPQWYFNGRIRTQSAQASRDSSLHIAVVRKEDLGVYQCVARSQDEWVTQVASLTLKGDTLLSKDNDGSSVQPRELLANSHGEVRGNRIKKNAVVSKDASSTTTTTYSLSVSKYKSSSSPSLLRNKPVAQRNLEKLAPPKVFVIDDNLAVLLRWLPEDGSNGVVRHYRVQYMELKGDTKHWSTIQTLENEITDHYFYVTSSHLQAQFTYMFRISVVMLSSVSIQSQWSRSVSFTHIYPVHPVIQKLKSFNASHMCVQWQYPDLARFPVTMYKVLVRKTIQEGNRINYSKFWPHVVLNAESTEILVGPLSAGHRYQVVVYGIKNSMPRKITKFSAEVTHEISSSGTSPGSARPIKSSSESNTSLMFGILGSLAGLMVLVIVVLVLMCYCRERKSVVMHRLNRYKDPAKLIHSSEQAKAVQSSFLLASISAAANANKNPQSMQDINGGEHASLLSTCPDNVYYQQKRQPPSGGSGHDMSDGEGVSVQEQSMMHTDCNGMTQQMHPTTGLLTPQPPAITYYKAAHGPASLPAGSLMRQTHNHNQAQQLQQQQQQQAFSPQRYSPGFQYAPQILYTNAGMMYSPASYIGTMYPGQQHALLPAPLQQQQQHIPGSQRQELCDMRSQDGGESVYSYFSQTSNNNNNNINSQRQCGIQGTVETGSQTMNSTGSAGHRHHRRKRRKTNNSGTGASDSGEMSGMQSKGAMRNMYGVNGQMAHHGQREVMYDTPPASHHHHQQDPRLINVPPGMVLMQPGMVNGEQCWGQINNTLTRRGTPTLFVEPPRIRDYSEYGIPHNQMMVGQPQQQLAHLSQQNLHLHNQNLSGGYRDAQA